MKRSGRSRARSRATPPAVERRSRDSTRPSRLGRGIGWTLLAALLLVGAMMVLRTRRPAAPPTPPPLWPSAAAAHFEGVRLASRGQHLASLPALRYAAEQRPDLWQTQADYAAALLNAVHEGRVRHGLQEFALRSSYERVAMVAEAIRFLDAAERRATRPRDVAEIRLLRGQYLKTWGFPWNAFVLYHEAQSADSTWQESAVLAHLMKELLQDPTRPFE